MSNNAQRILVVGLPETGKSSFIQALDEVLKHPASDKCLCSDGLAHDRSYIQESKEKFLAGETLPRTERQSESNAVELWFRHPPTGTKGKLFLPDEKGEVFRAQWINRQWEKAFANDLQGIAGALVFIRADEKSRNDERLGELAKKAVAGDERPFDMMEASAQVQLVDVLQFITEYGQVPKPLRIAVIISAWDTVGYPGDIRLKVPAKFLEREWALVAQYLRANPEIFTFNIYGVSAYGGEPDKLGDLLQLPPHERVKLVDGDETCNDLTRPVRWLLQLH